jgi:hypothetical protein
MKIYQNITTKKVAAFAIAALIFATGCKKNFLDVPPQGKPADAQFWKTGDDVTRAVNSVYANLRGWTEVAFAPIALESLGSDDTETGSDPSDGSVPAMNMFNSFTATSTQGFIADFWGGRYQTINLCNQVLDHIDTISMDATLKTRYIAEVKFVRAYAHFRLVRAFGDVPLRLHLPVTPAEINMPRTPKAQVYAAIEQDLTDAAAALPQSYSGNDIGRITKGAALALHAKVAMYQQKWADVLALTNQVKGLGYSLFPNYEQLFRTNNENSSESIFEIQAEIVPGNPDASNSQYSQVQGVRSVVGGGWGFNIPTQSLADAYEAGDPRRDATIIFRGETTPEGDPIPNSVPNAMYNQKSYVPFGMYVTGYNEGAQQNIRVIRYAEVLLMNAEAANELGDATTALADLELVRARARGGNNTVLPTITTTDKDALRTAIWNERHVELAMEFDRYFDVIRQGRAQAIFGPMGWKPNKNEVWPLPQSEIDLSSGTLTQNPGY